MSRPEQEAAELGLTIEHERSPLQAPCGNRRALLAAIYPHRKTIVLFENNIAAHCHSRGLCPENERANLIRHEIAHYREWLECRRRRKKWNPRCWKEELRIRRAQKKQAAG